MDVPFHPDESTYLFMSGDANWIITNPSKLFFRNNPPDGGLKQYYRLVDPPLTRYFIGVGRSIAGKQALETDWDWTKSWEFNKQSGALPEPDLLLVGRMGVALFFPFTLWGVFHLGKAAGHTSLGWACLILTSTNALVLIHTRRAMTESILLFGMVYSLLAILTLKKHRWLVAIPIAIAFNAKYLAAPMLLVALGAIIWSPPLRVESIKYKIFSLAALLCIFGLLTFAFNQVLWSNPFHALQEAVSARSQLMSAQVDLIGRLNPSQAPESIGGRMLALIVQSFIAPPAIADVGNYVENTAIAETNYNSKALHSLFRGFIGGGFFLIITVTGLVFWVVVNIIRGRKAGVQKRTSILFIAAFFIQTGIMLITIPLTFQRYYLALVPFITMFAAFGFWIPLGGNSKDK